MCLACDLCLVVIVIVCYLGFVNSVVAFGFCCYLIIINLVAFGLLGVLVCLDACYLCVACCACCLFCDCLLVVCLISWVLWCYVDSVCVWVFVI